MHGAGGNFTLHAILHFLQNRSTVSRISEPDDREHYRLLEGSKGICHCCLHCRLKLAACQL
jgi:hypothetical protein